MIFVAMVTGILAGLTIRWTTNPAALRMTVKKIHADLLEFRLYFDEPRLVWRAQMNLVRDNLRLFLMLLPAVLILALPMTWLFLQLEAIYGLRPLRAGEAALFTAQLDRPIIATDRIELHGFDGVQVEAGPVRAGGNQVAWRIRPARDGHGAVELTMNGRATRKTVMTGDGPNVLSPRRFESLVEFLLHPEEPWLPGGDLTWLAVDYPRSDAAVSWMVWFFTVSAASAWMTGRYAGINI